MADMENMENMEITEENSRYICKWHKELDLFYRLKPVIILEGNILDVFTYPDNGIDMPLSMYLSFFLEERGYQNIIRYDSLEGFGSTDGFANDSLLNEFSEISNAGGAGHLQAPFAEDPNEGPDSAAAFARNALMQSQVSSAVIFDLASRYVISPDNMNLYDVEAYTNLMKGAQHAGQVRNETTGTVNTNLLIILVNKLNDIPAWFYLDNPYVKTLHISTPAKDQREYMMNPQHFPEFFAPDIYEEDIKNYDEKPEELEKLKNRFVGVTEGFTMLELTNLMKLCYDERFRIHEITDVVDLYRYGIRENPWTDQKLQDTLRNGTAVIEKRVKGQPVAVKKTLDVIKRAATGMSGLQHSSHTKPKGILFFAGPTGTGKTEMAKTLAQLLFGDESRCIRFDMSEYSAEHSDQKLLGAPPGYVGYEAGGQLTNAVKENPFSILLFDEIEKAHGSILDKFLQILEDGRMTDGQGNTVYFSETIIIFTSNLGIYTRDERGRRVLNVSSEDSYEDVETKVREGVENYFKLELGRPEILNRIGENIVVFDFIRPEAAKQILGSQIDSIVKKLKEESRVDLTIDDSVFELMQEKAFSNLDNGGRGVGNVVEKYLLNPLSSYMLDNQLITDAQIHIKNIDASTANVLMEAEGSKK